MVLSRAALILVIAGLLAGCAVSGKKTGNSDWEVLTPTAAKSVLASPDSRFSLRLVSAIENRDFAAYQAMYLVPAEASLELFNLLADLEPGDFVRMESRFILDGEVSSEMSAWLVVKDEDRIKPDAGALSPVPGPQPVAEGSVGTASFALADKLVNYSLVMSGGEWKVEKVEGFSEEEEEF
jgi:hypothetical protein